MEKTSKPADTGWKKVKGKVINFVLWLPKLPFRIAGKLIRKWLRKHWKTGIFIVLFAMGLGMMFVASFRLRGAELVTVLVVAGILMAFAYIKMVFDSAVGRRIKEKESQDLAREKDELVEEVARLKTELDDEHNKKVKVLNIQPILEMGILEAECEVTRFFDRYFDKDDKEIGESALEQKGPEPRKPVKRFLGALTSKFKAKYGIDLRKVQIKRLEQAKTMYVAGAEPSFRGVQGFPVTDWKGSVGLHYWWGSWSIDEDSQKLESECKEKYRVSMERSLENGPEQLEWVKEPLKKHVRLLLKMMIAPEGYNVELVENADEGFTPLFDYLRDLGLEGPDQLFLP